MLFCSTDTQLQAKGTNNKNIPEKPFSITLRNRLLQAAAAEVVTSQSSTDFSCCSPRSKVITHVICTCSRCCCSKMSRSDSHCSHFTILRILCHPRLMDGLSFLRFRYGFFFNPAKHFHPFSVPKLAKHHIKECAGEAHTREEGKEQKGLPSLPPSPHHKTQLPPSSLK